MAKVKLKPTATEKSSTTGTPRLRQVEEFVAKFNKELRGRGCVRTGDAVAEIETKRERTGIPGLDYVLGGGLIRAHATQFWGAFKSCKTSTCARIAANMQSRGYSVALVCLEKFDKPWWRSHGVFIPYGDVELGHIKSTAVRSQAARYNAYNKGKPPLTLVTHQNSIIALDMAIKIVSANVFDLVIVDSLGVISADADDDTSIGDRTYGGAATPLKNFANKMTAALNTMYADGAPSPVGNVPNATMLLCINQARASIGVMAYAEDKKVHPTGGMALQHLWSQEVFFRGQEDVGEKEKMGDRQVKKLTQRSFRMKGTKMRYGTEGRDVEVYMCVGPHAWKNGKVWPAGTFDVFESLRSVSTNLGVVTTAGATITYNNRKYRGKDEFEVALASDPGLYNQLYEETMAVANLYTEYVPEVPA